MEIPRLNSAFFREVNQLEETKNSQKNSVCCQPNGVHYNTNPDSFVIDMNGFSNGGTKESSANSRITLQRNLSRKGSQCGGDKMIASNSAPMDRDSSSPTVAAGATMAEKAGAAMVAVGSQQDLLGIAAPVERAILRRNSFRRLPSSWMLDPKKVLLFFATVVYRKYGADILHSSHSKTQRPRTGIRLTTGKVRTTAILQHNTQI